MEITQRSFSWQIGKFCFIHILDYYSAMKRKDGVALMVGSSIFGSIQLSAGHAPEQWPLPLHRTVLNHSLSLAVLTMCFTKSIFC